MQSAHPLHSCFQGNLWPPPPRNSALLCPHEWHDPGPQHRRRGSCDPAAPPLENLAPMHLRTMTTWRKRIWKSLENHWKTIGKPLEHHWKTIGKSFRFYKVDFGLSLSNQAIRLGKHPSHFATYEPRPSAGRSLHISDLKCLVLDIHGDKLPTK